MLARQDQLNIVNTPLESDARLSQLLAWCEILEDQVRPEVSASIAYQLQDNGVVLCEPQDVILDAVATRMLHQRATFPNMNMLWASAKVRTHAKYAIALAQCAPDSLPAAIERCLLHRGHAESSTDLSAHACVFGIDPSKSNATQLLNALILSYTSATAANATLRAHAVWDAVSHAWPSYTSLLHTVLMMHGTESLLPNHAMRTTLLHYVETLQKGKRFITLAVENMFECP